MKKLFMVLLSLSLLCACSPSITEGEVYKKEFRPKHIEQTFYPIYSTVNGITFVQLIPSTYFVDDKWVIFIKKYNSKEKKWETESFYVNESLYNKLNLGDYFRYDDYPHEENSK